MKSRVQKWGNSLAVRIPKSFAEEAGLESNSPVEISLEGGKLVVMPVDEPRQFSLGDLLDQVTEANLHGETDTGPSVGREGW